MKTHDKPVTKKIVRKAAKKIAEQIGYDDIDNLTLHLIDAWYYLDDINGFYLAKYLSENMDIFIDSSIVNTLECMKFEVNYILSKKLGKLSEKFDNG